MLRSTFAVQFVTVSTLLLPSCSLLDDYPGGGKVETVFILEGSGLDPNNEDYGGESQDPLLDPPIDESVSVVSEIPITIANPGQAFTVHLAFTARNENVVGGGIRFPGSEEIQWTLFESLRGQSSGDILFGYVIDEDACDEVPLLCHESETEQFAVTQLEDGRFAVSKAEKVPMVLKCATCASSSCQDVFDEIPDAECQGCQQPRVCIDYSVACFDPEREDYDPDQEDIFDVFLGPKGTLWTSEAGCMSGEPVCENAFAGFEMADECSLAP